MQPKKPEPHTTMWGTKKPETYARLKTREELHLEQKNTTAETESRTKAETLCVGCYVASGSVRCGARGSSVCVCVICCWPSTTVSLLCLPRNLRRCPADARRRQGVHPTPWQAPKYCACHEICAGAQTTPDDARAYIRPLGKHQSTAPATKSAPVPRRRQTTPGRTSDPLASTKALHLPRNLRRCPPDARRRQGVHPTPWQAAKCCTCHEICAGAQPTPDDARAYIPPLGKQQSAVPATRSAHGGSHSVSCTRRFPQCETLCIRCCVSDVVCGMLSVCGMFSE